jgi:hypothetical protein
MPSAVALGASLLVNGRLGAVFQDFDSCFIYILIPALYFLPEKKFVTDP